MKNIHISKIYPILCAAVIATMACAEDADPKKNLSKETPVGSTMESVEKFCHKAKIDCKKSNTAGYVNQDINKVIGVKSMWAILEEKKNSPMTISSTTAYWGFDKDGILVDIWIWKTTDAP